MSDADDPTLGRLNIVSGVPEDYCAQFSPPLWPQTAPRPTWTPMTPTPNAPTGAAPQADDEKQFSEWFARNYPGPTVISDPHWHAPKIYREAIQGHSAALLAARREVEALRQQLAPCGECHLRPNERCDICGKVQHA